MRRPSFLLLPWLVLANSACHHPTRSSTATVAATALDRARCLSLAKDAIKRAAYPLAPTGDATLDAEISKLNAVNTGGADRHFALVFPTGQTGPSALAVLTHYEIGAASFDVDVEVSPTEELTTSFYKLSVEISRADGDGSELVVTQDFRLDFQCRPRLVSTTESLRRIADARLKITERVINGDGRGGSTRTTTAEVAIPAGAVRLDVDGSVLVRPGIKQMLARKGATFYSIGDPDLPIVSFGNAVASTVRRDDPFSMQSVEMDRLHVRADVAGSTSEVDITFARSSPFAMLAFSGREVAIVPEARWSAAILGESDLSSIGGLVTADPVAYAAETPFQIQIEMNKAFDFPNLRAYWTPVSDETTPKGGLRAIWDGRTLPATEVSEPLVTAAARLKRDVNLASTEWVQVDLPEIQEMVARLKAGGPSDRLGMAKAIAKVVTGYLTYDHTSADGGAVYPLSTAEILQRRQGLCQHFANLFVTLARGVGLPARMVSGFYIGRERLGGHGWVEIETSADHWYPVEPQSADLTMKPWLYIPLLDNTGERPGSSPEMLAAQVKLNDQRFDVKVSAKK